MDGLKELLVLIGVVVCAGIGLLLVSLVFALVALYDKNLLGYISIDGADIEVRHYNSDLPKGSLKWTFKGVSCYWHETHVCSIVVGGVGVCYVNVNTQKINPLNIGTRRTAANFFRQLGVQLLSTNRDSREAQMLINASEALK